VLRRSYGNDPGILRRTFNMIDRSSTAYEVNTTDPTRELPNLVVKPADDVAREYNVTNLTNGYTVLTES
jgi:hypothetical protein